VADPCIVSWPARLSADAGGIRHQFAHAIDVLPTVLELTGVGAPPEIDSVRQSSIDGTSFGYLLGPDGVSAPERHHTQHFEMFGSRAIYHRGWKAVTFHPVGPLYDDGLNPNASFDDDVWELYHVAEDISESRDLAGEDPDRVAELVALWWEEARQNQVLPLDNRVLWTLAHPKPDHRRPRDRYRYFPGGAPVPEQVAVNVRNRSHAITVDVSIPSGIVPEGTLLALGCALGGWSFHVFEGRLRYVHNLYGKEHHIVVAESPLPSGDHTVSFEFEKDKGLGGDVRLACDGETVARATLPRFTPSGFNGVGVGLTCGYEWGPAVGPGYLAPYPFTGLITKAIVETTGPIVRDQLAELAAILAEQ
jgi:arylsulfatase